VAQVRAVQEALENEELERVTHPQPRWSRSWTPAC
jgi:hypothetical protein